jgi:hypothetical protein
VRVIRQRLRELPEVADWDEEDAERWWKERRDGEPEGRRRQANGEGLRTIDIDLADRA